jgi:hypothetical protein
MTVSLFSARSLLLAAALLGTYTPIARSQDDFLSQVPDKCQIGLDDAIDCVLRRPLACFGILDLVSTQTLPADVNCGELAEIACQYFAACPPCETEFSTFIVCIKNEIASAPGNVTVCNEVGVVSNVTSMEMNMTDSNCTKLVIDPELATCNVGPGQC